MSQEQQQSVDSKTETAQDSVSAQDKVGYTHKTDRIRAWSQLIKSVTPYLWAAVIIVVLIPLLGKGLIAGSSGGYAKHLEHSKEKVVRVEQTQLPKDIDQAIAIALNHATSHSKSFAAQRLNEWVDELMTRVDDNCLEWYFNYFNQKKLEFSTPFVWLYSAVAHWTDTNNSPPKQAVAEKFAENFQTEFAKRVLRPQTAQLELEKITRNTISFYVTQLEQNISNIQSSYNIPQGDWERYLDDIGVTIHDSEGNISNLSLKVLTVGSSYLLAKAMIPVVAKIGSKIAVSLAGKAGAKMAAKTGGVVAGKIGAELLDPIVSIGIIIWDVWDYNHTVAVEKPILRDAIYDYLQQVKYSLLEDPESGIMTAINQVESGIMKSRY